MKKLWKPTLLLAALIIMAIGMLNSGAWFTDTVSTPKETVVAGTLSIQDGPLFELDLGELGNMAPGDVTDPVSIIIKNDGSLDLVWVGDLVVEGNSILKEAIYIETGKMDFSWPEKDDPFITNGQGSGDYPGAYNAIAKMNRFGLVGLDKFDGTSAMGVAPYEFTGALKPGQSYTLTLAFGMASGADNAYQGLGDLKIGFAVKATQYNQEAMRGWHLPTLNNYAWYGTQLKNQE